MHPKPPIFFFLHQSFLNVFTRYRKENCPKIDQRNNDTILESTFISDLWVTFLHNADIHRVVCSLGAITLKTVRRTFLYWAIKALFYAKNFFCSTMWKENIKAQVTSLLLWPSSGSAGKDRLWNYLNVCFIIDLYISLTIYFPWYFTISSRNCLIAYFYLRLCSPW